MLRQRFGFGSKGMETGTDVGLAALCSGVISPLQLASLELFAHLASQRMRFPPAQVNDPCRSHIHPATPSVVGQPSETVLYRELPGPWPSAAALFVYTGKPTILPDSRGICPIRLLRFKSASGSPFTTVALAALERAKLSVGRRESRSWFTGRLWEYVSRV